MTVTVTSHVVRKLPGVAAGIWNHLFQNETHLPNLHDLGDPALSYRGDKSQIVHSTFSRFFLAKEL